MAKPRDLPLIDYLHAELDAQIGRANVSLVLDAVIEWLRENNRGRTADQAEATDSATMITKRPRST